MNGFGMYEWNDRSVYIGDFRKNKIHGFGEKRWVDGLKYRGFFVDNKRYGFGVLTLDSARQISCTWVDNKQHGFGIYYKKDEEPTFAVWNHGQMTEELSEAQISGLVAKTVSP